MRNLAPVCTGCHIAIHNGNIAIAQKILDYIGEDRLVELEHKKRHYKPTKQKDVQEKYIKLKEIWGQMN